MNFFSRTRAQKYNNQVLQMFWLRNINSKMAIMCVVLLYPLPL